MMKWVTPYDSLMTDILMATQHNCSSKLRDFIPLSRFFSGEVQHLICDMEGLNEPQIQMSYTPHEHIQSAVERAELFREII